VLRRNYFHASYLFIYLFIYYENHTRSTVIKKKKLEIHWSMLNAHCVCRKATLYFLPAIAAIAESLEADIVTDVLIRFPIITQHSNSTYYFHRVVGLVVVNTRQCVKPWDCVRIITVMLIESNAVKCTHDDQHKAQTSGTGQQMQHVHADSARSRHCISMQRNNG